MKIHHLLVLVFFPAAFGSTVARSYYDTEVSALTTSERFTTPNASVCQEKCDNRSCEAYNFNPASGICQLFKLQSDTNPAFACSRPIPVKMPLPSSCSYELATTTDMCLSCEKVRITTTSATTVRASCGSGKLLVFITENSTQPRFSKQSLDCNTTGWSYKGEAAGAFVVVGCGSPNVLELAETCGELPPNGTCPPGADNCVPYERSSEISPRAPTSGQNAYDSLSCPRLMSMLVGGVPARSVTCMGGIYRTSMADRRPQQAITCFTQSTCSNFNPSNRQVPATIDMANSTGTIITRTLYACDNAIDIIGVIVQSNYAEFHDHMRFDCVNGTYFFPALTTSKTPGSMPTFCWTLRGGFSSCVVPPSVDLVDVKCPLTSASFERPFRKFEVDANTVFTARLQCHPGGQLLVNDGRFAENIICNRTTGGFVDESGVAIKNALCCG